MLRPLLVLVVVALIGACADDAAQAPADLSARGRQGFVLAQDNGCFACHGVGGVGNGLGPVLVGAAGATVTLDDGTTVVADTAYLRRSITDPAAEKTAGFVMAMPANTLDADQVDTVVAWIEEISGE